MSPDPPSPWAEFLQEPDRILDEPFELRCVGGFGLVAGYGLSRSTNDLDYLSIAPHNRVRDLETMGGEGSPLARKYKVHVHHAAVASVPENYEERLTELFPGRFKNLRLLVLDPYDIVLSKLSRNMGRDRDDVQFLARTKQLDPRILRDRYEIELRPILIGPPERHDATLEFWIEAYFSSS
jgi:hypothetical protein